ncbi:MAG TPA: response regulator transcription factor [Actinomycetota bacterium]|nr:response regulator transcription factor [Actinomycetota bacterium]
MFSGVGVVPMNIGMDPIRLLVVDDGPLLVESLSHILPRRGSVRVRGPVHEPDEAAAAFEEGSVDLALIDIDRTGQEGIGWIGRMRRATDRARILVMTEDESAEVLAGALGAGACGFVSRRTPAEELLRALKRAVDGELVIPVTELHRVVRRLHRVGMDVTNEERVASLTTREREVLLALTDGLRTLEVAARLGISVMTVQSHVKSILAKLGVHSKVEAVTLAWRAGLVPATHTA